MKLGMKIIGTFFILSLVPEEAFSMPKNYSTITITVFYDNNEYNPRLETAWGFSCLIEGTEKTILFDTGGDGKILLSNMSKLKIDPGKVEMVVLSHIHGDHVGGVRSFLDQNSHVTIYLPRSFPVSFKEELERYGVEIVDVDKPLRISENVFSTGELGTSIKEQALIINTEKGLIIITGCAHPGIVNVLKRAKEMLKKNVYLVMGGFHLKGMSEEKVDRIIEEFKREDVQKVGPCHCSGNLARRLFQETYNENFILVGAGKIIEIPESQSPNNDF